MTTLLSRAAPLALAVLALRPGPLRSQEPDISKALPYEVTIRPGDVLQIGVWPDESLGGQFVVEESGLVYLPILGQVQATGISLARLRYELRAGYGELMKNPVVTITPLFHVGVVGSVQRPGTYLVNPTQNVFDVLLEAGWLGDDADIEKIRVVREGRVIPINARQALEGGVSLSPITLRSGDRIVVPSHGGVSLRTVFTVVHSLLLAANLVDRIVR